MHSPLPPFPITTNPPPPLLFLWLNGWWCLVWCAILLNDIMDLHMPSLDTLVTEGAWCMFYATWRQVEVWDLTKCGFCWYSNMISHTQTHTYTHKDTQHTQGPVDLHTHINIYLHHSSYLYNIEWTIHWYQKITFHDVFSFQESFTCKGHISVD